MNRKWLFLIAATMIVAGCRVQGPAEEGLVSTGDGDSSPAEQDDAMVMRGIDLYMHRKNAPEGVAGKPELWVRADSFSITDARAYEFENARAIIYGDGLQEDIVIEANRGSFEQDRRALLEGDVRMTAGTLRMQLRDIEWVRPEEDSPGVAQSDSPVIIDDPELQLNAAALRLYPDERLFELDDVSGVVRFDMKLL